MTRTEVQLLASSIMSIKVTKQEYTTTVKGTEVTVPMGIKTTHMTALGIDEKYNFVNEYSWYKPELTGFARKMAIHDFVHYGINVPADMVVTIEEYYFEMVEQFWNGGLAVAKEMWKNLSQTLKEGFWPDYDVVHAYEDQDEVKEAKEFLKLTFN